MLNTSINLPSRDARQMQSHMFVTILTLLISIVIFVPAYFLFREKLSVEQDLSYMLLLIAALVAFNLFFFVLRTVSTWQVFPFVLLMTLFLASYYFKFWQITIGNQPFSLQWRFLGVDFSSAVLMRSFEIISTGFVTFCLTATVYMILRPRWTETRTRDQDPKLAKAWGELAQRLAIILPILSLIVLLLLERYDIGIRGYRAVRLPFRMSGIIYYVSVVIIPALMLLLIHASRQSRKMSPLRYPLLLIVVYYFMLTVLFASRGNLIYGMLAVFALLFSYPEYRRRSVVLLFIAVVFSILVFGLVTYFRYLLLDASGSTLRAIGAFLEYNPTQAGDLIEGAQNAVMRITGADSLLIISSRLTEPVGLQYVLENGLDLDDYYTHVLLGLSRDRIHRAAPSLFGWFYLAGELWAVWLGTLFFTLAVGVLWDLLHKLENNGWLAILVIQALFVARLVEVALDGGVHRFLEVALVMLGTTFLTTLMISRLQK